MARRRILITGGMGFIGSSLAQALVRRGDFVRILDAMLDPYGYNFFNLDGIEKQIDLRRGPAGDVRDVTVVRDAVKDVDVVIDLAAQVSHTLSLKDPFLDLEINCRGSLNLLEAVRQHRASGLRAPRLLFGSTRGVIGRMQNNPVTESHPCAPTDLNGIHKMAVEHYYRLYHQVYGLETASVRINNTYGPRCQMRHDDYGVVNWFVRRALLNESIVLHGDGRQKRDYNYIDDVVDAFLRFIDVSALTGECFQLGSGQPGIALKDVVQKIIQISKTHQRLQFIPRPVERAQIEIGDYEVSIAKIQQAVDWVPQVSLDEGLARTIQYYRQWISKYV